MLCIKIIYIPIPYTLNMLVYFIKCVWVFARLSTSMTKINTFGNLFFVPESEGMPLVCIALENVFQKLWSWSLRAKRKNYFSSSVDDKNILNLLKPFLEKFFLHRWLELRIHHQLSGHKWLDLKYIKKKFFFTNTTQYYFLLIKIVLLLKTNTNISCTVGISIF